MGAESTMKMDRDSFKSVLPALSLQVEDFKRNTRVYDTVGKINEIGESDKAYAYDEDFKKAFGLDKTAKITSGEADDSSQVCKVDAPAPCNIDFLPNVKSTVAKVETQDKLMQDGAGKVVGNKDRHKEAGKVAAADAALDKALDGYQSTEAALKEGKHKGTVEKVGDTTIYKNEQGQEVFRRQGDKVTAIN